MKFTGGTLRKQEKAKQGNVFRLDKKQNGEAHTSFALMCIGQLQYRYGMQATK